MLAARAGSADSIAELLARGAKVDASESAAGENALMWAAARNNQRAVVALLRGGAAVDARSKVLALKPFRWETDGMLSSMLPRGGWTPLAYAAREGSMEAARALVEAGAALNVQDPDGTTPLVTAIENGHFDLALMLLNSGADPNIADSTGMAALFAAVDIHTLGPIDYRPPPVLDDNATAIDLINALIAHKADVNARLSRPVLGRHIDRGDRLMGAGSTPLMRAAKTNDIAVMKLLVEKGADRFALQDDLTSVLMIAANGGARPGTYGGPYPVTEEGALEAVKLCLDWGLDVNAFNTKGQTALHSAVSRRAKRLIQLLVDNGARLDMVTKDGRTVLSLARTVRRARDAAPATEGPNEIDELVRKLMAEKGIAALPDNAPGASGFATP
jgi:ankyrin repeat protein